MRWVEEYQTVPFVNGGRSKAGADCWGLIKMIVRDQCKVELPEYGIDATDMLALARAFRRETDAGPWQAIENGLEQTFDVAVMRVAVDCGGKARMLPTHAGIVVGKGFVLHTEEGVGPVLQCYGHNDNSLQATALRNRLQGFYRYKNAD